MTTIGGEMPAAVDGSKDRSRIVKLIHVGRREVQMSDEAWRTYLQITFAVTSSTQLSLSQLQKALKHLRRMGFQPLHTAAPEHEWSFADRMPERKRLLLWKILKLMEAPEIGVARGAQVAYVEGIAKQMGGCNGAWEARDRIHKPLCLCSEVELQRIVGAIAIQIKRVQNRQCTV